MSRCESEHFTLVAHRGNSADAPENTIASFDSALDSGFPHFETDCQLTADGVVVVLHDEHLGRTTPGAQGPVAEATWADLRHLDAGSWFGPAFSGAQIPRLVDLLQRYRSRAHIHLELKSGQPELPGRVAGEVVEAGWAAAPGQQPPEAAAAAAAAAVVSSAEAVAKGAGSQQQQQHHHHHHHPNLCVPGLTITSFHLEQLRRSLQVLPGVAHGWLVHELTEGVIQEASAAGCQQVCPRANVLTPAAVQLAAAAGLSVRAWGIKDMQLLRHVVHCGCQGATVNWPRKAREELLQMRMQIPPAAGAPPANATADADAGQAGALGQAE